MRNMIWSLAVFSLLAVLDPIALVAKDKVSISPRSPLLSVHDATLAVGGIATNKAFEESEINEIVKKIDEHFNVFWSRNGIHPTVPTTDAEYLRRVTLDLLGRIPSVAEIQLFTSDNSPGKRQKLVSGLLLKARYSKNMSVVLRQQWLPQTINNMQFQGAGVLFQNWLQEHLKKNTGLDEIVRHIVTAPTLFTPNQQVMQNDVFSNSAYSFNMAHEFKPENVAASVSRLFMGVKIECAQCHDHPFSPISRDQFWETAAFFADLQPVIAISKDPNLKREIRIQDVDPKKRKTVQARFLDDTSPVWRTDQSPRATFASWLTSSENQYFSRNAVERLWYHFFGYGFIDPIDEMGEANPEMLPEVVDLLAQSLIESHYDMNFIVKIITCTRAYQLSSKRTDASQDQQRYFARMNVKSMSAEQLMDSLEQATGAVRNSSPIGVANFPNNQELLTKFASTERSTERQTSILQSLTLMNGTYMTEHTHPERGSYLSAIIDAPFLNTQRKIESLFLASLCRYPTTSELQRFTNYVERGGSENNRKKALADTFWALLNSTEFILNH